MKTVNVLMSCLVAAGVAACGKSEEAAAPAPVAELAPAEAPAAKPAEPPVAPEPVMPAPPAAPAALPAPAVAPSTAPDTAAAAPARPAAPAATPAAPAAPAIPVTPAPPAPAAPVVQAADLAQGQAIYRQACAFCHDRGVANAPKTGDAAAWSSRIAQGMDTLYTVAIRGKGAMPAKGGNPSLKEDDVKAAVDYMVAQSR